MAFLVEGPWTILFIGIAVEAILGLALMQTGRGKYFIAMIGMAVVVVIALVVERLVVTDREAVEQTLDAAVAAARKNDVNGVLDCISPSAKEAREYVRWIFGRFEVQEGHISDLDIKINRLKSPPTAEAKFLDVGKGRDRNGEAFHDSFVLRVLVKLRLEGKRWLVTDCDFPPELQHL